jgi:hypothetical protein
MQLARGTPPLPSASRGAAPSMLRMLEWLARHGGRSGREVPAYLNGLTNTASHGPKALQRLHFTERTSGLLARSLGLPGAPWS